MADPVAPTAAAPAAASRSRIGAFGAFIMSAFTSVSGGVTFPPEPEEIEEGERQAAAEEAARRERVLHSVTSFDDQLLRDQYNDDGRERRGHRAIRRLRSSTSLRSLRSASSMSSLRKRFRRAGKADGAGISEIAEMDEEEGDHVRSTPSAAGAVASPTIRLMDNQSRGVFSTDSSEASTVSRSNTDSTRS